MIHELKYFVCTVKGCHEQSFDSTAALQDALRMNLTRCVHITRVGSRWGKINLHFYLLLIILLSEAVLDEGVRLLEF